MPSSPSTNPTVGSTRLLPVSAAEASGGVRELGTITPVSSINTGSVGASMLASVRSSQSLLAVAAFGITTLALDPSVDAQLGMPELELVYVVTAPRQVSRALDEIVERLATDPVEDGIGHSAQLQVSSLIRNEGASVVIERAFAERTPPSTRAALIQLLGRDPNVDPENRRDVVERGLASGHLVVRDAAAQAAENWDDPRLRDVLGAHRESVPWLARYVESVASALRG